MAAAKQRIGIKTDVGGYARYEHDYYHQVERDNIQLVPGNPWIICTLWRAQFIIQRAKSREEMQEALDLLQWCVKRADRSGVLAEQFHPYTGEPISVSPLTWSHATFVIVVVEYLRKLADIGARARAGVAPGIE
jgi:GH15 family glucan-1,4-alpha-glucosidase